MSREEQVKAAIGHDDPDDSNPLELRLQLDVRLRLDEVAEIEAERLRANATRPPTPRELGNLAGRIYDARRIRDKMMNRKLFGEPAWDMLLALYCLPTRGELLTITGLTHAANASGTTGHRWQQVLTEEELIERGPEGIDKRKQLVRLTDKGRELLQGYLTRLYYYDAPAARCPDDVGP